jgi:hypothetical protein
LSGLSTRRFLMPYMGPARKTPPEELNATVRVLQTVQKQIESYTMSLAKVRVLREELGVDRSLSDRILASPEAMVQVLESRGIPKHIAVGMAAEDFKTIDFPGAEVLGRPPIWTWECCCTECCFTLLFPDPNGPLGGIR